MPVEVLEAKSYFNFSAELQGKMYAERVAASATIEVTRRCPLECVHYYNSLPMGDLDAKRGELTYDEHCRLLDEMAEAGCLWVLYTGGEIFARKDFLDIYTYAKKKGFLITLFTNGTIITPKIADYLVEWRPFSIEITLYGRTKETYEKLTGIRGSYDRCMRGINLLRERGLPLALKSVAISFNKHEIGEMKKFAEELGVHYLACTGTATNADCQGSPGNPVPCSNFGNGSKSNLYHGCLYAGNNGFTAGGLSGRQNVTIQSNLGSNALPPTATGITAANLAYWVTVRTVQTIPQLFSAVLGNTTGTIAARATAGIAIEVLPNSLYGLDREDMNGGH